MSAPLLLLAVLCPLARAAPRSADWGQGNPGTIHAVFAKVARGAEREKWARENETWFSRLIGRDPVIEAKVRLDERYLPQDSPLLAEVRGGEAVVEVGRAALDAAQSEGEMAFLLAHELHHTLVKKRKRRCLLRGLAALGSEDRLEDAPQTATYRLELEREADAWGQRYMADAGYNPLAAVDAIRHVSDLGEALGADPSRDAEHDPGFEREQALEAYGQAAPFEARCPWAAPVVSAAR